MKFTQLCSHQLIIGYSTFLSIVKSLVNGEAGNFQQVVVINRHLHTKHRLLYCNQHRHKNKTCCTGKTITRLPVLYVFAYYS